MAKIQITTEEFNNLILNNEYYSTNTMIGSDLDLPITNQYYFGMLKTTHTLITTCDKTSMSKGGIRLLLEIKKLYKRNQDFGIQISQMKFSVALYVLCMYLVRFLRHPWRKELRKIKTYCGAFKLVIAENIAPPIYKDLMGQMDYIINEDNSCFVLSNRAMGRTELERKRLFALDLFLAHAYVRMQAEPELLSRLQGKATSQPIVGNPKIDYERRQQFSSPVNPTRAATTLRNENKTPVLPERVTRMRSAASTRHQYSSLPESHKNFSGTRIASSLNEPGTSSNQPSTSEVLEGYFTESASRDCEQRNTLTNKRSTRSKRNLNDIRNSSDSDEPIGDRDSLHSKIYYPPKNDEEERGNPDGSIEEKPLVDSYSMEYSPSNYASPLIHTYDTRSLTSYKSRNGNYRTTR